jgi:hypothetical protein
MSTTLSENRRAEQLFVHVGVHIFTPITAAALASSSDRLIDQDTHQLLFFLSYLVLGKISPLGFRNRGSLGEIPLTKAIPPNWWPKPLGWPYVRRGGGLKEKDTGATTSSHDACT